MHHRITPRKASVSLLLAAALAGLLLAGCGSSSSKSTQTVTDSASATAPGSSGGGAQGSNGTTGSSGATGPTGARGARFKALRECLQKNGVTLPKRPQGSQGKRPGGGLFGGTQANPVNREKLQAALKKCGAGAGFGPGARAGRARLKSPAFTASLTSFAKCMRENGVNLPAPNTSGKGPVFDTKGIDTTSTTFTNARKKCQSKLGNGFGAGRPPAGAQAGPPGEGGPPPGEGAPPAGAPEG